jgi:hypothetical protein
MATEEKRLCPECGFEATNAAEEIAHMEAQHRDVIDRRLREAGIVVEDYRHGPDLPSIMTLHEFRQLNVFIEQYGSLFPGDEIEIGILVRDRGRGGRYDTASWIEFSVGKREFAMWRHNLDLYEVDPVTGAVHEEPLHRND